MNKYEALDVMAQERVALAKAALELAEQDAAAQAAQTAMAITLQHELELHKAAVTLVQDITSLVIDRVPGLPARSIFVTHRKELTPLAAHYGCKIVQVGSKSHATVTLIKEAA